MATARDSGIQDRTRTPRDCFPRIGCIRMSKLINSGISVQVPIPNRGHRQPAGYPGQRAQSTPCQRQRAGLPRIVAAGVTRGAVGRVASAPGGGGAGPGLRAALWAATALGRQFGSYRKSREQSAATAGATVIQQQSAPDLAVPRSLIPLTSPQVPICTRGRVAVRPCTHSGVPGTKRGGYPAGP